MRFLSSRLRVRSSRMSPTYSWTALLGIVCIALVLMIGIIQVAHSHPSGHPDPDCSLCVTAHQAVQVVALITLHVSSQPIEHVSPEPARELPRRSFFFRLDCRPPPAQSAFA
jgi:hypothetical protein